MSDFNTSFNPWMSIWTKPRETIARIVQENPNRGLWWLALIYGFSSVLNTFQSMLLGLQVGILPLFLLALIIGPLWGYVTFSVWGWVVSFTGRWLKGVGNFKAVRSAYAWSCVPLIVNAFLWFVLAFVLGRILFTNVEGYPLTQSQVTVLFLIFLVRIAVAIWSLVIYLNALAEVQKFSILRTIGNVLLAGLLIGVVFYLAVFLLFGGLQGSQTASHMFFLTDGAAIQTLRHL